MASDFKFTNLELPKRMQTIMWFKYKVRKN